MAISLLDLKQETAAAWLSSELARHAIAAGAPLAGRMAGPSTEASGAGSVIILSWKKTGAVCAADAAQTAVAAVAR